jgi:hypothetical protein
VLFFGELAGVAGAVLAVPLTTTFQIIARELLAIRRAQMRMVDLPTPPEEPLPPMIQPPGPVPPATPPGPIQ